METSLRAARTFSAREAKSRTWLKAMSAQASSAVVAASLEAVTTGGSLTGSNLTACFLVGCLCSRRGRCSSGSSRRAVVCHGVTLPCDSLDFAWFDRFCLNVAVQFLATSLAGPSRGSEFSCRRTCRAVPSTLGSWSFTVAAGLSSTFAETCSSWPLDDARFAASFPVNRP